MVAGRDVGDLSTKPRSAARRPRRAARRPGPCPAPGSTDLTDRRVDRLGFHAGALDLAGRKLDRAVVAVLAFVDGDVVHPHRILLRHRRGVRQSHRVAVVFDLAFGLRVGGVLRRRRLGLVEADVGARRHGAIVASVRRLPRRQRIERLAVRVPVVDRRAGFAAARSTSDDARAGSRCRVATKPAPAAAQIAAATAMATARFISAP